MKKGWMAIMIILLLTACAGGGRKGSVQEAEADSTATEPTDSAAMADEVAMPVGADELFDDFFFNYASDLRQQRERTVFPLTVTDGKNVRKVQRKEWKQEPFFMNQDYYTLIFDSPAQMDLARDTMVADVTVERIYMDEGRVEQFLFSRCSGRWMLHEVKWQDLPRNANAQFLRFYEQFAADTVFQHQSLADQIVFSGPDPDDDFSTIDGVITPDFWKAFRPELPQHILYNMVYCRQDPAATHKILLVRGIANGLEVEITFRLHKGRWKLTKLLT